MLDDDFFFDVLTVINQTSLSNSSCDYQLEKWELLELEDTETHVWDKFCTRVLQQEGDVLL